jgi:hypothetical protein
MRAASLVFGLGLCAVGALGWVQAKPSAPMTVAGIAVQSVPAGIPTLLAPAGVRLDVQDPPGPKQKSKPPKASPGQRRQGHVTGNKASKVTLCHRTHSAEHPSKTIKVSERAWKAHERHGDTRGTCSGPALPGK